jgi:hypothetical protein
MHEVDDNTCCMWSVIARSSSRGGPFGRGCCGQIIELTINHLAPDDSLHPVLAYCVWVGVSVIERGTKASVRERETARERVEREREEGGRGVCQASANQSALFPAVAQPPVGFINMLLALTSKHLGMQSEVLVVHVYRTKEGRATALVPCRS